MSALVRCIDDRWFVIDAQGEWTEWPTYEEAQHEADRLNDIADEADLDRYQD